MRRKGGRAPANSTLWVSQIIPAAQVRQLLSQASIPVPGCTCRFWGHQKALPCPVPGVPPVCVVPLQALLTRRKSSKKFCMYDLTVTVAWRGHWVDDESKKVNDGAGIWWGAWLWHWLWKWLWPVGLPAAQSAQRVREAIDAILRFCVLLCFGWGASLGQLLSMMCCL